MIKETAGRDSFAFSPKAKIKVRLRRAVAGGAHPRRIYLSSPFFLRNIKRVIPNGITLLMAHRKGLVCIFAKGEN